MIAHDAAADDDDSETSLRRRGLTVQVRSATKDSLAVAWKDAIDHDPQSSTVVSGYKVRYQAVGSSVVQYSHLLQVSSSAAVVSVVARDLRGHGFDAWLPRSE